ncbi:MAG: hypothetical protein EOP34_11110 [Rickettsiales bacterium]|nr:MAG: hypothetical protein EOP34_11110 [Rickettsiales bacterium]
MSYRHTYQDEVDCEECCKGLAALLGCIVLLPAFAVGVPIYGACIIVPKVTKKIKKRMLKNRLKVIRALFINKYCSNTSDYSDVQLDKASYGLEGDFRCVYKEKNYSMYITPDWLKLSNVLIIDNIHSRILENLINL